MELRQLVVEYCTTVHQCKKPELASVKAKWVAAMTRLALLSSAKVKQVASTASSMEELSLVELSLAGILLRDLGTNSKRVATTENFEKHRSKITEKSNRNEQS